RERRQVPVGAPCRQCAARVNDDHLAALVLCLAQKGHEMRRRTYGVMSPDDDKLAVHHIGVGRAPALAERRFHGVLSRGSANAALQLTGAEPIPQARARYRHLNQPERTAVAIGQNRFGAMAGNDLFPLPCNQGNGVLPGNRLPLAGSFRTGAAQWMEQAVGMINMVKIRTDLGAEPAVGDGMFRVAAEADGTAGLDFRDDAASIRAI